MSIQFACEKCGHSIDVDDRLAGKVGHCKHCGQSITVPGAAAPQHEVPIGLKLRPVEGIEAPTAQADHHAAAPALQVRPLAASAVASATIPPPAADSRPIEVLDPDHWAARQAHAPHLNPHYETRLARWVARLLRETRDRLYLLSIALLVLTLIGFLFKIKAIVHLGAVGVVFVNIVMLVDGVLYLIVLPFRQSLAEGLGVVLIPPYAIYYWIKHWDRLRKPLLSTIGAFTPIFLAGLAYGMYEEAPVIWEKVEEADRAVEKAVGIDRGPARAPGPPQPGIADQAKQVLGHEANIIQDLAKPQ